MEFKTRWYHWVLAVFLVIVILNILVDSLVTGIAIILMIAISYPVFLLKKKMMEKKKPK